MKKKQCVKNGGHWWHPTGMIDWFCCICDALSDGPDPKPGQLSVYYGKDKQINHICFANRSIYSRR